MVHLAFSAAAAVIAVGSAIYPPDNDASAAAGADTGAQTATHAPAKLSVLAGNDEQAWESAHSVHVEFAKRSPH